ncbi:hypothetical protein [Oligoflexus tunisiensis]|uniref:hypothetical protein n=1 Tax=Oligoflexus tunisiensis TaxID=708132 RepID=UPI00114CABAD|nr:hypothetical protein [Oligoflexus tunisiensis]
MFSKEQAIEILYRDLLKRDETQALRDRPIILDRLTRETSFGWVFGYNNEEYAATLDPKIKWVGAGPILFNKNNGEFRRLTAGESSYLDEVIEDYEREIEAQNGHWVLRIKEGQNKLKVVNAIKQVFGLEPKAALSLITNLPCDFLKGTWRELKVIQEQLKSLSIQTEVLVTRDPVVMGTFKGGKLQPSEN